MSATMDETISGESIAPDDRAGLSGSITADQPAKPAADEWSKSVFADGRSETRL